MQTENQIKPLLHAFQRMSPANWKRAENKLIQLSILETEMLMNATAENKSFKKI